MKATLIQVATFIGKCKKLGITDEDIQVLEQQLMEDPEGGDVMRGTGGVRKVRFAPPSWNKGKSGAARVCYALFASINTIYLLTIFGKNEQANLTPSEKAAIKVWMTKTKQFLQDRR